MPFPEYIPTRTVTVGAASELESAEALRLRVQIRGTRSVVWAATGYRLEAVGLMEISAKAVQISIDLPRTDVPGWKDAGTGADIDVSAAGSHSHTYTADVLPLRANGTLGGVYRVGPFPVPSGVGPIDISALPTTQTIPGVQVVTGPSGTGVDSASTEGGNLTLHLTDGTTLDAGALPVGEGASDEGVASYIGSAGSASAAAVGRIVTGAIASDGTAVAAAEATVGDAVAGLAVMQYVYFGSDVNTDRPAGDGPKVWVGQGEPVNALVYELVVESTYSPPPAHLPPTHSYLGAALSAAQWSDGVGAAHLTQPTAERQPEVVQVNGTNVARLRGGTNGDVPPVSGFDAAALAGLFRNKPGETVMALFRKSGAQTAATRALFNFSLGSSGSNGRIQVVHTTAQRFKLLTRRLDGDSQASVTHSATVTDGAWALVVAEANWAAGTFRLRVNGVDATGTYAGAGNSSDTAALRGVVGGRSGSTASPIVTDVLGGDLAAVLVWDSVLDSDDFTHWEGVLNTLKTNLGG